jgi:hypothetical protein
MRLLVRFFLCMALCWPGRAGAQMSLYQADTSIKVYAYSREQTMAWSGGFNTPQFSMGDLNKDGLQDLVVFTPWTGVQTFINRGSAGNPDYRYAPEYALNFPPIYDYLALADYNCDGISDLFHQGSSGFSVYRGYYNSRNQLCFAYYKDLYYSNDIYSGGPVNAFNNPGDIPAIVDVDHDGDLDFISYDIVGGNMDLYRNMQVELGLPCDSIHIALKDRCWGKVYQGFYRTHMLDYSCSNAGLLKQSGSGSKKTHSGNTPCLFDWDMDGDYDYLDGSVSFNQMTFLKNGKIEAGGGTDSMISQDTAWQAGGIPINLPSWPAAYNVDVDQDGRKDILVTPNAGGLSENYKCILYYKNLSAPGAPNWVFQSDSFLTDMTIDLGTASYPALFDYDKDGKPDLFVGSDGYYQASGTLQSRLSYYRNTSVPGSPSFTLQTTDLLGISSYGFKGAAPAFGDIDDDGIADMIIGHSDGTLSYFKNIAASDLVTPIWQLAQLALTDASGTIINTGGNAAPFIYDIDKDGKKDLIIGSIYGYIQYYRNVSATSGTISLKLINTKLGNAKADPKHNYGIYSAPFIGKIDSTDIEYLLLGSNSGNIYRFTGFQGGDTAAVYTLLDSNYAFVDSTYNLYNHQGTSYGIYSNLRSTVTVGDIAGDGGFEMITGNVRGGLELYKQKIYIPHPNEQAPAVQEGKVQVFPNPATNMLQVRWDGIAAQEVSVSIINMAGQVLHTSVVPAACYSTSLSLSAMPQGLYICLLQSGVQRFYNKFTIIR